MLWRVRPCIETCPNPLQEAWPKCKKEYKPYISIYNTCLHQKLSEWKQSGKMSPVHTSKCFYLNRCPPFSITKQTHSGVTQLMHKHDKTYWKQNNCAFPCCFYYICLIDDNVECNALLIKAEVVAFLSQNFMFAAADHLTLSFMFCIFFIFDNLLGICLCYFPRNVMHSFLK